MAILSEVMVKLKADLGGLKTGLDQASGMLQNFGGVVNNTSKGFKAVGIAGAVMGTSIGAALTAAAGFGIKFNAEMETAQMSFETLLGSADKAKGMISNLQAFAANTPFEFPGIQKSAKLMLAMGFNAEQVMPSLNAIGNAVSAIGGNEETLNGVTVAIGQMMTKGKISAEEMNQLAERGIGGWDILAKSMGKSKAELMALAAQGKLMSEQAIPALMEGMQSKYAGAMEKQAKTFTGTLSTLKDTLNMFMGQLSKPMFEKMSKGLQDLTAKVVELQKNGTLDKWAKSISDSFNVVWTVVSTVGGVLVAIAKQVIAHWNVLGPVLAGVVGYLGALKVIAVITGLWTKYQDVMKGVNLVTKLFNTLIKANPVVFVISVIIGAVVALRHAWVTNWGGIQQKTAAVGTFISAFFGSVLNDIAIAFNRFKAAVFSLLLGIMDRLAPVVGLIGKIAPGFESGFENARAAVSQQVDDITLNLNELSATAGELSSSFIDAQNSMYDTFAGGWRDSISEAGSDMDATAGSAGSLAFSADDVANAFNGMGSEAAGAGAAGEKAAEDNRTAWEKAIDAITAKMQALNAQYELNSITMDKNASEADKLALELSHLKNEYALQQEIVDKARQGYEEMAATHEMTAKEVVDAASKYATEAKTLAELSTQINGTSLALAKMSWQTEKAKAEQELLNAEHELAISQLGEEAGKMGELTLKAGQLNEDYEKQGEIVKNLQREYKATAAATGENSEETRKANLEFIKAQTEQNKLAKEICDSNTAIRDQAREMSNLVNQVSEVATKYRSELKKAQDDYFDSIAENNRKLREDEQKVTDDFKKALDDRAKAISNFVGLFEQFTHKDVSGSDLLGNLGGQVDTLKDWKKNLSTLATRGIDEGLLAELKEMGPKAADEIAALTTLSDSELTQYVALWKEKNSLARAEARTELEGLRAETQEKIAELRMNSAEQLSQYYQEWQTTSQKIKDDTTKELQTLVDNATKIGGEMIVKLAAAISSKMPELSGVLGGIGAAMMAGGQGAGDQAKQAEQQKNGVLGATGEQTQGLITANTTATQTVTTLWTNASTVLDTIHTSIKDKTLTTWNAIDTSLDTLWNKMLTDLIVTWDKMKAHLFQVITEVDTRFNNLVDKADRWGIDLMGNFISGIRSQFSRLIRVLEDMAETVDSFMPHSPAKRGALSSLGETGPGLVTTFADGITNSLPYLRGAMGKLGAAAVPGSIAFGGLNGGSAVAADGSLAGNTFEINITGSNGQEIWEKLERELARRGVRF
jgi:tape measure domain-containing protein